MHIEVIIPARKNSKGLPGKNLKILSGKPLIDYTISTALKISKVDKIVLTSDSEDILERGKLYGIKTLLRPSELAKDDSQIIDTILHAAEASSKNHEIDIENVLLLQPTFPLRDHFEIIKAINLYKKKNFKSLVSIVKMKEHPCECISFNKKNPEKWEFIIDPKKNTNRQSYSGEYFFINGNFYIAKLNCLKTYKSFFFDQTQFFECGNLNGVDIDDINDFKYAEYCFNNK